MRPRWNGFGRPQAPPELVAAVAPADGERLLAWGSGAGTTVVAGRHRMYVLRDGGPGEGPVVTLARPWHLVDAGTWSEGELRVTWVDRQPPVRVVVTEPGSLPETLRERVQASVVLAESLDLGERRTAKVVVRRDLATQELLSQAVLGPGVRATDPGVSEQVRAGVARVREQVGLD